MGASNAMRVSRTWAKALDGNPYKALMRMALIIRDDNQDPQWYGGMEPIAHALGRIDPPRNDQSAEAKKYRNATETIVYRAMSALREKGAIKQVRAPAPGVTAAYAVRLDGPGVDLPWTNTSTPCGGEHLNTVWGQHLNTVWGNTSTPCGVTPQHRVGVEEQTEEPTQEHPQETRSPLVTASPAATAPVEDDQCCDDAGWIHLPNNTVARCPVHFKAKSA